MIVHLVRHGETALNRDGMGLGRRDVSLTELGMQQVELAVESLARRTIGAVYSSPLSRARVPAEMLADELGISLSVREALTEMDVGETEGLTFAEMGERFAEFLERWRGPDPVAVQMPGGESLQDVWDRTRAVVEEIEGAGIDEIAVFSHNFVLRLILCRWLGMPAAAFRTFHIDLASITTVSISSQSASIVRLNDTCHLQLLEPSVNRT